jgi:hypothetical protein
MVLSCGRCSEKRRFVLSARGSPPRTAPGDAGGMALNPVPARKECNHGGHSSVVDEGSLV